MLRSLSIRDVVLIDRLELEFISGLAVLTGETGAGKSILLDALGLALGVRAESRLVRHGAEQAAVTAEFDIDSAHPAHGILAEHGIDGGGDGPGDDDRLLLRRILTSDGRSRAFVNDQPVSVSLLRQLGDSLVEVHGQFESQRLLDASSHRQLLDAYGELRSTAEGVAAAWETWRAATAAREQAEADLEKAARDEDYLRHATDELAKLNPKVGEEEELAARRTMLMHAEKLMEAMNQANQELASGHGAEDALRGAVRHLERVADKAEGRLDSAISALSRAASEAAEGAALLEKAGADLDLDPTSLEGVEERLFALRGLSRKHGVDGDALPALGQQLAARVAALEDGGEALKRLKHEEETARAAFAAAAAALGDERRRAAASLDLAVAGELQPLRLGKSVFATLVETLEEPAWSANGMDRVSFQVATNPGAPLGPLKTIASGGELSRFMLALKVVLAEADPVPTIIFDEVDSGIGGAVAAAVGERLARLASSFQILVVTHSPQVAARGGHHLRVSKTSAEAGALTSVGALTDEARKEEIARMLAGASVTEEARAAADSLLRGESR